MRQARVATRCSVAIMTFSKAWWSPALAARMFASRTLGGSGATIRATTSLMHYSPFRKIVYSHAMLTTLLLATAFSVGTATANPGQKASGTIEVPAGVDAALSIPGVEIGRA